MNCIKCARTLPADAAFCPFCGKKQSSAPRKALKRPNGTGTVYKLSGRRTRPWVAAKNKVIIGYYAKKTEALEALERLAGKPISERYNMTFAEVFDAWKVEHYREIGTSGIATYNRAYDVFAPLHDAKFRSLRTADFQGVLDANAGKKYSTLSKYKQLITQMSNWAIREEIITTSYARFVKLEGEKPAEKPIFSAADIAALEADGSPAARLTLVLIYTGMRLGELFSMPVSGFHETYLVGGEKTAAGRNRIIPIRPEGRAYVAELASAAAGDLLISGYAGQRTASNFRKRDFYPLLERLGIDRKTPHATRHTFASWAVSSGIKPELLQKILGHASYDTTANIYVHADAAQLVAAVEPPRAP